MEPTSKAPRECTKVELAAFCRLVRDGGQVHDAGLEERVERAKKLVLLYDDATLAGTAAIKDPTPGYRRRVFQKAQVPDLEHAYRLELGYVVVEKDYKGRKLSRLLVEAALEGFTSTALFATSRADRERMHRTLARYSFSRVGEAYMSDEEQCDVLLFVRPTAQQPDEVDEAHAD